tara:strand:- start:33 stop:671 length:639 start_codon:yes stop_codon:yes gene_type:complete
MIDPKTVTNYNRTPAELQEWLLYCICVAGKRSNVETRKLDGFLQDKSYTLNMLTSRSPFNIIRRLHGGAIEDAGCNWLMQYLKKHRISPYQSRYNSFTDVVRLLPDDLSKVTVDELQAVRGIGTKTSRFFLTHSREDFDEPVLDTHILRFLRDMGHNVPSVTPQSPKKYAQVAGIFKSYARSVNKTVAELDLEVWNSFSKSVTDHIAEYSST